MERHKATEGEIMAKIIKSNDMEWLDSSDVLYNDMFPHGLENNLLDMLDNIHKAKQCLDNADGLNSFECSITNDDIEKLVENLRKFIYFCNGIHYEISELVDTPFSIKMGELAMDTVEINPSDYKYSKPKFLWFKEYFSITDLIGATIDDENLKKSFNDLVKKLDEDEVSIDLKDSIKEANWWQEQFKMAEEIDKTTDEIFTPEVRSKWVSMTADERDKYIQKYKNKLDKIYFGWRGKVPNDVEYIINQDANGNFEQKGYGAAYSNPHNYIKVNESFKENPTGMYSVDKLIDTMTHEMRHRYQEINTSDMPDSIRDEWNQQYISSSNNYYLYYRQPVEEDAKAFAALAHDNIE